MIDRLLDVSPLKEDDAKGKTLKAEWATSNTQHQIVNGGGGYPADSMGVPWSGAFVTASGNLYADFMLNATAEMQGRLQVARLYHMTDDTGVRNLIRFLVTRDHMHQMQWLRAVEELKADGLDGVPVPAAFDLDQEYDDFARLYVHASDGADAMSGGWAHGEAYDGSGEITVEGTPRAHGDRPTLPPGDPRLYGTPPADPQTLLQKAKDLL
jgi:Mn-containing catalase